ncbi:formylglycine-generating enzyme family protein [Botrimarina sp.]|uniref:formylglycine-generating enzyme family protein n=1 Tax=Botrimarina sp. TaxID=2795802 RepID=UPI0032ED9B30
MRSHHALNIESLAAAAVGVIVAVAIAPASGNEATAGGPAELAVRVAPDRVAPDCVINLVLIPAGEFRMGSSPAEPSRDPDEGPRHPVRLSKSFYLGKHEVTQALWTAVMGSNPAEFDRGPHAPQRPVECVSWDDCQTLIARLNDRQTEGQFRLPTEAEWEYACRAGSGAAYSWGPVTEPWRVNRRAWANSGSQAITHPVGEKPPNAWGLYDMHGGVWEWCADRYGPYPSAAPVTDPAGPPEGEDRVIRGGSWYDPPAALRSANRHRHEPEGRYTTIGVRLAFDRADSPEARRLP